jgi:hypothetical protein
MQTYLKKGVCPFTPPSDQYWHSFTRGIDDAVNNLKIIGVFSQISNNTIRWNGSVTRNNIGWLPTKRCHENLDET